MSDKRFSDIHYYEKIIHGGQQNRNFTILMDIICDGRGGRELRCDKKLVMYNDYLVPEDAEFEYDVNFSSRIIFLEQNCRREGKREGKMGKYSKPLSYKSIVRILEHGKCESGVDSLFEVREWTQKRMKKNHLPRVWVSIVIFSWPWIQICY